MCVLTCMSVVCVKDVQGALGVGELRAGRGARARVCVYVRERCVC